MKVFILGNDGKMKNYLHSSNLKKYFIIKKRSKEEEAGAYLQF